MNETLARIVPRVPWEQLADVDDVQIAPDLLEALQRFEGDDQMDLDRLTLVGLALSRGHGGLGRTVVDWLASAPSSRRLDVVSALLLGLWRSDRRAPPIDPDTVRTLIAVRGALLPDEPTDYNCLIALVEAALGHWPIPMPAELREVLRGAMDRQFSNPHLKAMLDEAISRVPSAPGIA